ncbi:MAG: hypothetical protein ACOZNI_32220 [Myxococcota bacterium]
MFGKKKPQGFFEKLKEDVRKAIAGGAKEGAKVGVQQAVRVGVRDAVKQGILDATGEVRPKEDNLLSENEPEPVVKKEREPV